jgi:arylsulfatase A-like enzyme
MSVRKIRTAIRASGAEAPGIGVVYVLGLSAWTARRAGTAMDLGVVAVALALGLVLGWLAGRLSRARLRPTPAGSLRMHAETLLVVAVLHAALLLASMAHAPGLYSERWYAEGGLPRTVQILATDVLGRGGVALLTLVFVITYVKPRALMAVVARLRTALAAPFVGMGRPAAAVPLVLGGSLALVAARSEGPRIARAAAPDAPAAPDGGERPNVLLLAVGGFRADRLSPRVAPTLSGLAHRGTRFDRAYVSHARTFPSWVTLLTGRHPHRHGIRSMLSTWDERARDLDALPQRLARAGWTTAIVSDHAGDVFGRIDLGFAGVDVPLFDFGELVRQRAIERQTPLLPLLESQVGRALFPRARDVREAADPMLLAGDVERILDQLARPGSPPFFLTAYFGAAEVPYASTAPYYARFAEPDYRGRFKYESRGGRSRGRELAPDPEDVRQIRALYDGAVSAVDAAARRVLGALDERGLAERTIVVVTADHGETLFDHGHGQGHGDHLFGDEATHVPLIVYDPRPAAAGGRGTRVSTLVRDVDLVPTLDELCGLPSPEDLDGASLAGALRGESVGERLAYGETGIWLTEDPPSLPRELRMPYPGIAGLTELDPDHPGEVVLRRDMVATTNMARHRMVRDERWKLVYAPTRQGVRYFLFDTLFNPGETVDVAYARPDELARLRAELWSWMLRDPEMEQRDGFLVPRDPAAHLSGVEGGGP